MGAEEPVATNRTHGEVAGAANGQEGKHHRVLEEEEEKKEVTRGVEDVVVMVGSVHPLHPPQPPTASRLQTQAPVVPIQVFPMSGAAAVAAPSGNQPRGGPHPVFAQQHAQSLNPRGHTNRITLFVFLVHMAAAIAAVCFLSYKSVIGAIGHAGRAWQREERRHLTFWLLPIEGSSVLGIVLAFVWQKALRAWPQRMAVLIVWFSFLATMAAGVLLLCFSLPATDVLGVALVAFSIGNGLYACWIIRRVEFAGKVFAMSLRPVSRFPDLNHPTYMMLSTGFLWISLWCFAVIGALNFHYPPLTILAMVLSLMWTAEVLRNVANLTVSRVIALYYLRGMQSSTQFCFQRVVTRNLGSACLGSLFVPAIEACRIIARGLNLLEGEDEFMFSCAHCCLRVMNAVFRFGNSWAFVHIAAYGRGFVQASRSTWALFESAGMVELVDADITSSICFLSGVSSGAVCLIFAASWSFSTHKDYTATVSLLGFFVGYLMTRIGMALPHACVGCYYTCYAENPTSRLFDSTIPDRIAYVASGREAAAPTPRFPRRFAAAG